MALDFQDLARVDQQILYYMHCQGPVFAAKLAKRLDRDQVEVRTRIAELRARKLVCRVTGRELHYRIDKRNAVTKHRNHTYYTLTRQGKLLFRRIGADLDINLRPPWLQA